MVGRYLNWDVTRRSVVLCVVISGYACGGSTVGGSASAAEAESDPTDGLKYTDAIVNGRAWRKVTVTRAS